jgi:hypothetical protein
LAVGLEKSEAEEEQDMVGMADEERENAEYSLKQLRIEQIEREEARRLRKEELIRDCNAEEEEKERESTRRESMSRLEIKEGDDVDLTDNGEQSHEIMETIRELFLCGPTTILAVGLIVLLGFLLIIYQNACRKRDNSAQCLF